MIPRSPRAFVGAVFVALAIAAAGVYIFRGSFHKNISSLLPLTSVSPSTTTVEGFMLPSAKNTAFKTGEKLYYDIVFKGVTVGHATVEVTDGPMVNGRPTLKYMSKAESTPFFDHFFKVRDESISTVDKNSLFALSFDQNLHEGNFRAVRRYDFDYLQKKYTVQEKMKGKTKINKGALALPLHDVLSALYYVRTRDLFPGKDTSVWIYREKGTKHLPIKIGPSLNNVKTTLGTFSCLRVEPLIQGDSLFKSKDGGLAVWMTNDEKKLPVFMEANASVGLVRVKLMKWEN